MKIHKYLRTTLAGILAAVACIPVLGVSAAIPCSDLPIIEADPMMPVPMIYIELPVTLEAALSRGGSADREGAQEATGNDASRVTQAAENQFRCLGYGEDVVFVGNSTPQQRVNMFARPNIEADIDQYIAVDALKLVDIGTPLALEDGRFLIDFAAVVNGDQYLTGELVFVEEGEFFYLDGSAITSSDELNGEPVTIELSTRFTREVKIVPVKTGDTVRFENLEEESSANIVITNPDGEVVFEGFVGGTHLVGGENKNVFVIVGVDPGDYQVTVTFSEDDITYGATLSVSGDSATPEASPES